MESALPFTVARGRNDPYLIWVDTDELVATTLGVKEDQLKPEMRNIDINTTWAEVYNMPASPGALRIMSTESYLSFF